MNPSPPIDSTSLVLLLAFSVSVLGLFVFIWSMSNGFFNTKESGSHIIFEKDEIGLVEDPATSQSSHELQDAAGKTDASLSAAELDDRLIADKSSAIPAFVCLLASMCWLIIGSAAAIVSSIKLHNPDWLVDSAVCNYNNVQ